MTETVEMRKKTIGKWFKDSEIRTVILVASLFFILTLTFSLHRYYSFYANTDQGIFNQVFWNSIHGHFLESSLSSSLSTNVIHDRGIPEVYYSRSGQHFTPAQLLWLPLYALFPSPATLLFLQVTLLTAGGIVLYQLARLYLIPGLATTIALSYYATNAITGPALGNFFDYCQIPLYVFGLLWAIEKQRWWLFWLLAALILAVREDAGVVLFSLGFYFTVSKRPQLGLAICTISLGYMLLVTNVVMPLFSQDIAKRFMMEKFSHFADGQEASTIEIIRGIFSNPFRLLTELFNPFSRKLNYLIAHWLPLAFLPAISLPAWLCTAFPLAQLFLQEGSERFSIYVRYAVAIVPGLFYGMVIWWSNHQAWFKPRLRRFWGICLSLSVFFSIASNPHQALFFLIPDSIDPWVYQPLPVQWHHVTQIKALIEQIPADASVSASRFLIPRLSGRRAILLFPGVKFKDDRQQVQLSDRIIVDLWQLQRRSALKKERMVLRYMAFDVDDLLKNSKYGLVDFQEGVVLFEKGSRHDPAAMQAWLTYRQAVEPIVQKSLQENPL